MLACSPRPPAAWKTCRWDSGATASPGFSQVCQWCTPDCKCPFSETLAIVKVIKPGKPVNITYQDFFFCHTITHTQLLVCCVTDYWAAFAVEGALDIVSPDWNQVFFCDREEEHEKAKEATGVSQRAWQLNLNLAMIPWTSMMILWTAAQRAGLRDRMDLFARKPWTLMKVEEDQKCYF